jgi:hypothetical protein
MPIHPRTLLRRPAALFSFFVFLATAAAETPAANSPALEQILKRLDRLEQQNRQLLDEVRGLRRELAASRERPSSAPPETAPPEAAPADNAQAASIPERLDVEERRLEEQAQTKVESSQHMPVRITGMALFNAFLISRPSGLVVPILSPVNQTASAGGATLRQTILGLDFRGPETFGGGKVHGFLNMDFFGGPGEPYDSLFRIRTAGLEINWENTSVMFGQDKPLISPREPNSLAQVGVSPLTGAGNLWLWQPQARVEQRFHLDDRTTFRAQLGLIATREDYGYVPPAYASTLQNVRPALEGRFSLSHSLDDERRIEIGSGFDASTSHVAGVTVPARGFALDWFANPWRKLEFSGAFFRGRNLSNLGAVGQGFTIVKYGVIPVHATGGWAQLSFVATPRLTFNLFSGEQDNRGRDLIYTGLNRNLAYAGNLMYRLAPNVILSLENGQVRTNWIGEGKRLSNYHDLGFAYLF